MASELEDLPSISSSDNNAPLFDTQLILDSRLAVKSSLTFGVEKSGQQITGHSQQASSASPSGVSFEITVPSLSTIISRKVMIRSRLTLQIKGTPANGDYLAKFGVNMACAPFPFQQMVSICQTTINNSAYTFDSGELLSMILRQLPKETLDQYADTTPVFLDNYAQYSDCVTGTGANQVPKRNSPFTGNQSSFLGQEGRGSYNLVSIAQAPAVAVGNLPAVTTGNAVGDGTLRDTLVVIDIIEPLLMSPFLLSTHKDSNSQGIYGIQGLSFNFTFLSTTLNRAIRGIFPGAGVAVTLVDVDQGSTYLDFTYITPHASLKLPARSLVPYLSMSYYKTIVSKFTGNKTPLVKPQWSTLVQSNSHNLKMIPDFMTVGVRLNTANRNCNTADTWLPILSCQVSFEGGSYLNNTSQHALWEMTRANGVNITWNEFRGYAIETAPQVQNVTIPPIAGALALNAPVVATAGNLLATVSPLVSTAGPPLVVPVGTCGSLLKLAFGKDIPLQSDWLAPGSIAMCAIQVNCTVGDNTQVNSSAAVADLENYEICLMMQNSGFIATSLGASSSYLGVLTKAQVLDASQQDPVNKAAVDRVMGGGMHSLYSVPKGSGFSAGKMSAGKNMRDRLA